MRIGVVGSRRRNTQQDYLLVEQEILRHYNRDEDYLISEGCPTGADEFANIIAKKHGLRIIIHYPWWNGPDGKAAGFVRNTSIAYQSTMLIACVAPDRTGGTEDTIRKFLEFHGPDGQLILL